MDTVNVRNLEQIQEEDAPGRSRLGALLLASVGGAALVVAGVMTVQRTEPAAESTEDPLAALVAKSRAAPATPAEELDGTSITFSSILSDAERPTTAVAAVKDERGRLIDPAGRDIDPAPRPAATPSADQLPSAPLAAGTLLGATPVTTEPKDELTRLAAEVSKAESPEEAAPMGGDGGYQLQVASFKQREDADRFVEELRQRGHQAYRQAAYVPERGLWHRVRIGPFKVKLSALNYQKEFERTERMSTFLVDPEKVKRQQQIRAAKVAARQKRSGR